MGDRGWTATLGLISSLKGSLHLPHSPVTGQRHQKILSVKQKRILLEPVILSHFPGSVIPEMPLESWRSISTLTAGEQATEELLCDQ